MRHGLEGAALTLSGRGCVCYILGHTLAQGAEGLVDKPRGDLGMRRYALMAPEWVWDA